MRVPERDGLIARIRQVGRAATGAEDPRRPATTGSAQDNARALEARVEHLEQLVQGLQDSVHRESSRQSKRITDLETRLQPGALAKALSDDARARGL